MIKVLKLGSMGPIVEQWQTFLRGQGLHVDATGLFGPETDAATRAFQRRYLRECLEANGWNVAATARQLDVARSHVYALLSPR